MEKLNKTHYAAVVISSCNTAEQLHHALTWAREVLSSREYLQALLIVDGENLYET